MNKPRECGAKTLTPAKAVMSTFFAKEAHDVKV